MTFDKTKLTFRVKAPKSSVIQGVLNGWQQINLFGMGVMHDREDSTKISICFFDEPDSYCTFENVELEEYKEYVKKVINKLVVEDMELPTYGFVYATRLSKELNLGKK